MSRDSHVSFIHFLYVYVSVLCSVLLYYGMSFHYLISFIFDGVEVQPQGEKKERDIAAILHLTEGYFCSTWTSHS
ncbi:hypothetical protein, unlikely [Trypanosoma brucei brucei TREU927]|uniref:Uncharacterized protein n=1 Tax=Trypanosoma brucei brucei (strain 927/4 GUTat10.1) TaxID=185431 RepID=Q38DY1_TRYB2|nr:hypothetical protein, unlikely [Trypanosoma brucei brucei TREU927]EAN76989.1 hypothetical protein, unlikely [Trypanosoma brucei brucei TREU927]